MLYDKASNHIKIKFEICFQRPAIHCRPFWRENPKSTQMKNALFIFEEKVAFIFAGLDLCVCVCNLTSGTKNFTWELKRFPLLSIQHLLKAVELCVNFKFTLSN